MTTVFHTDPRYAAHTLDGHPEHAGRLQAIVDRLEASGLINQLTPVTGREASRDELLKVHEASHLDFLATTANLAHPAMLGPDTYVVPGSYALARQAAGGVMNVVDAVVGDQAKNGLAAVRPPGHHATPSRAMGFCLLNNIAIGARFAQHRHQLERVAIVDFDVHHGNGTQDVFYEDPSVLFISSHQSPLYPGTGHVNQVGRGMGRGMTINLPVPPGTGDESFRTLYDQTVLPALVRFQPQLLLVSAGFDAHWRDPLANLQLSLTTLAHLAQQLKLAADELCTGRIIFVVEGGYDLDVLSHGVANLVHVLLGDGSVDDPIGASNRDITIDSLISEIKAQHGL